MNHCMRVSWPPEIIYASYQGVGLLTGVSGGSAAQNGVFHVFDAILGVVHATDFLERQRDYMPRKHRDKRKKATDAQRSYLKYYLYSPGGRQPVPKVYMGGLVGMALSGNNISI